MRERRCISKGKSEPESELIRFVSDPDGDVVVDIAAKLPGRGAWVSAERKLLELAISKGKLARALNGAKVPADLIETVEGMLVQRALSLLGLARKGGALSTGMDAVRIALKAGRPAWRIEAADGADDGRGKLDRLAKAAWGDIPVAGCFSAEEIGQAVGRDSVVHAVLAKGSQSRAFGEVIHRLSGFRIIDPKATAGESG
jgi:predicted RNA-binding protein YlxR (DUF448 family)